MGGARVLNEKLARDIAWLESQWKPLNTRFGTLRHVDRGRGEAVVFVPIFTGTEFTYSDLIHWFETKRRTILYERRESVRSFISLEDRVEELKAVLDALAIRSAHLNAHSDGGMVAIAFAAAYPDRVLSLTLYSVADVYRIPPQPFMQWFLTGLYRFPLQATVPNFVLRRLLAYYGTSESGMTFRQNKRQIDRLPSMTRFFKYSMLPLLLQYDGNALAPRVRCPVQLFHHRGVDRILRLEQAERLAGKFARCYGFHLLDKGGHMIHYTMAGEIASRTFEFWNRLACEKGEDVETS